MRLFVQRNPNTYHQKITQLAKIDHGIQEIDDEQYDPARAIELLVERYPDIYDGKVVWADTGTFINPYTINPPTKPTIRLGLPSDRS